MVLRQLKTQHVCRQDLGHVLMPCGMCSSRGRMCSQGAVRGLGYRKEARRGTQSRKMVHCTAGSKWHRRIRHRRRKSAR